jgi:hypothetical protein
VGEGVSACGARANHGALVAGGADGAGAGGADAGGWCRWWRMVRMVRVSAALKGEMRPVKASEKAGVRSLFDALTELCVGRSVKA